VLASPVVRGAMTEREIIEFVTAMDEAVAVTA
jgi:hypothetical protein